MGRGGRTPGRIARGARSGRCGGIRPVPRDSQAWGTPIDRDTAIRVRSHPGHSLDPTMRRDFEVRLNRDLGDVRIHDDQTARDLVRSLGAEAFTLGNDISTTHSDRALLAEIVHTVQQEKTDLSQPSRMQASFEKTTADLDPKVEILLDLHLRSRGKRFKEIAETKLLIADSWWKKLRAKLENKAPTTPVDAKAEIEAAMKEIRALAPLDTDRGDPIQNGNRRFARRLYLRINDAPELAAMILIEFPYSRTTVPVRAVVGALASEKTRGQRAVLALPRIWKTEKPKGAVAETWTQEITDAVDQSLQAHSAQRACEAAAEAGRTAQSAAARRIEHS